MTVIDVHAHVADPDGMAAMARLYDNIPVIDRNDDHMFFRFPSGVVNGPVPLGMVSVERRLADMATSGVTHQVLSARPQVFPYDLPGDLGGRLARLLNESMVNVAATHPDAFSVMISLPVQTVETSLAEIARWAPNPLVRGVMVDSNIAGRNHADPEFDPIWRALEQANLPVLVHPYQADVVGKERLKDHYLFNLIGNPADTTIAIGNVVFGGLLQRFPALRWCFVHGGGVAPFLAGRWDHGWSRRAVTRQNIPDRLPSELLGQLWFDCLVHRPAALGFLADLVGWGRIMVGTDYPFDMGMTDPVGFINSIPMTSGQREAVLFGNAERYLRPRV